MSLESGRWGAARDVSVSVQEKRINPPAGESGAGAAGGLVLSPLPHSHALHAAHGVPLSHAHAHPHALQPLALLSRAPRD